MWWVAVRFKDENGLYFIMRLGDLYAQLRIKDPNNLYHWILHSRRKLPSIQWQNEAFRVIGYETYGPGPGPKSSGVPGTHFQINNQ